MAAEGVVPKDLRCEYRVNPLGIDVAAPRLSWVLESSRRGEKQTAYQVLVASSEENLAAETGDLWDTGKVASDRSVHVAYAGKPLRSRMRCYWKVRAWNKDGKPSGWTSPALWTMGLLAPTDWEAKWIGCDGPACPHLRKTFAVAQPVRRAMLYATALGLYELHLNGRRVGDDRFTPGWTDYHRHVYYNTYDVTGLLRQGANAIGAILAPGWYAGHVGLRPEPNAYGRTPWLRARLEIEYADGTTEAVATDESWRAHDSPLLQADILMGETYDARRQMPGWDAPGFDESAWHGVDLKGQVQAEVQAYPGVTVQTHEEIEPVQLTQPEPGVWVFDLGQEFSGWARLKVKGNAGDRVVLRFAEMLQPDGTLYTENLRKAKCTDTYILRGGGEEVWEPRFTYHAFRYVEITGYPGEPSLEAITGVVAHSATPQTGSFECSNDLINRLQSNIVWTQRANFFEVPTDCPQRDERLGWTGDAQIFARTATYNMDVSAFFTKWLVDLENAQGANGAFPDVAPRAAGGEGTAAWGDAGVICPWTLYQVYGDTRVLERHYDAMVRWIKYLENHSENLLRPDKGYGDWLSINAKTPRDVLATAYFAYSTRLVSEAATVLGKDEDAKKYAALFARLKEAFNKAYVSNDGRIKGNTQTCYVLALRFDLLPEDKREAAAGHLVKDIKRRKGHLSTGFVGLKDLLPVLTETGNLDVAYRLLTNETFPSWGYPIKHGATTIWERWDGWTAEKGFQNPQMNSFCHYAFGAVGEWLFATVAGIDTDGPGFKRICIRPRPGGGLTWTKARYHSIHGRIVSDWKIEDDTFKLNVTIPANTTATIYVPAKQASDVTEGGTSAPEADGVTLLGMEDGAAVFAVGSGTYQFVAR